MWKASGPLTSFEDFRSLAEGKKAASPGGSGFSYMALRNTMQELTLETCNAKHMDFPNNR